MPVDFAQLLPRYTTKEQEDIFNESDSKECKTNLECRKVKCGENHSKNWAKLTKYASFTSSQLSFLSLQRFYQLEEQDKIEKKN